MFACCIHIIYFSESADTGVQGGDHQSTVETSGDNNSSQTSNNMPGKLSFNNKILYNLLYEHKNNWEIIFPISFKPYAYCIHIIYFQNLLTQRYRAVIIEAQLRPVEITTPARQVITCQVTYPSIIKSFITYYMNTKNNWEIIFSLYRYGMF